MNEDTITKAVSSALNEALTSPQALKMLSASNNSIFKASCAISLALIAIAISFMFQSYFSAVSKQPEIAEKAQGNAIIGAAFMEGLGLIVAVLFLLGNK